jgi:hypothetical protein
MDISGTNGKMLKRHAYLMVLLYQCLFVIILWLCKVLTLENLSEGNLKVLCTILVPFYKFEIISKMKS